MSVAFIPVYISYLGIEAYGLIGLFAIFSTWLALLDIGLAPMLGREMARFRGGVQTAEEIRDLLRSVEIAILLVLICVVFLFFNLKQHVAQYWIRAEDLSGDIVANAIAMMGLISGFRLIEGIYRSTLLGLDRQILFNALLVVVTTCRAAGAIFVLHYFSPTIFAFFLWQGVISFVSVVALAIVSYHSLPKINRTAKPSIGSLKPVWRYSAGLFGITFLALLFTQVDKIILSKMLPLSEFGEYALAVVLAGGLYFIITPISQAFYPRLCSQIAVGEFKSIARTFHSGAQLLSITVGAVAITLAFHSQLVLYIWTGDAELSKSASMMVSVLLIGNFLNGLVQFPYNLQLASGRIRLIITINIIGIFTVVPSQLMVTSEHGATGAAYVWLAINFLYVLIGVQFMLRSTIKSETAKWYIDDVGKPLSGQVIVNVVGCFAWPWDNGLWFDGLGLVLILLGSLAFSATLCSEFRNQFRSRDINRRLSGVNLPPRD